jgi:formylglycine-generating enzyme required for sulfatase activity
MKRFIYFVFLLVVLSLTLSACNLSSAATEVATEQSVTALPTAEATEPVFVETEAPTLQSVNLAGPVMELGSKYVYVDGTVLIAVPGGPFIMGYNFADNPERVVNVGDTWIYSTKVTNQQYALCVQAGKCSPPETRNSPTYGDYRYINFPVTGVNHAQAGEYCTFVKGRLPTEAEWEKTARGPEGNIFPWGNQAAGCSLLNYAFCEGKTTNVNDYETGVSYYGAWDMSGNAREWVADWYSPTYNVENPVADPLGPEFGEKRSVRGSSYQDSADPSLSAHRFSLDPLETLPDLGFRCVVEDPTAFAPWCEQVAYTGNGPYGSEANCTPEVKCNDVSILQSPLCTPNYTPYTIVTFGLAGTPPDGWSYSAAGCSALPGEQTPTGDKYQCDIGASGPLTAEGSCVDTLACVPLCPPHYNKIGDTCVWDGSGTSGTECLPGATYNPLTQCCTADSGTGVNFNLCPVGMYPLDGACVPNPSAVEEQISQDIIFETCTPPGDNNPGDDDDDDGGNNCNLNADTCRTYNGLEFSSALCCCGNSNLTAPSGFVCLVYP